MSLHLSKYPTPRTEAAKLHYSSHPEACVKAEPAKFAGNEIVNIDHARQLEQENAALREVLNDAVMHFLYIQEHGCRSCAQSIERSALSMEQHAAQCFIHKFQSDAHAVLEATKPKETE